MKLTDKQYISALKTECSFYGFIDCPLTDSEILMCRARGLNLEQSYSAACDRNAGFTLATAIAASLSE